MWEQGGDSLSYELSVLGSIATLGQFRYLSVLGSIAALSQLGCTLDKYPLYGTFLFLHLPYGETVSETVV